MSDLRTATRFAFRELRTGFTGFRIFFACLFLGVMSIAGVGALSSSITAGLQEQGQAILGGDVDVRLSHREANQEEVAWLSQAGTVSTIADLRSIAKLPQPRKKASTLIQLKAIDDLYPLYGKFTVASGGTPFTLLEKTDRWGALVEQTFLDRTGAEIGDAIAIGRTEFTIRDVIVDEPDRLAGGLAIGPRVIISYDGLRDTGLIQPGALNRYHYRIVFNDGVELAEWKEQTAEKFPLAGWRIQDSSRSAPGVRRFVERVGLFLSLVGLTALVVGGVGVGNAVRAYLEKKVETIATLKCLGASGQFVFRLYLIQILVLALGAIALGCIVGASVPWIVDSFFSDVLPVPLVSETFWSPLLIAGLYGFLTALAFAIWPLARAQDLPPARLFRDLVTGDRQWPRKRYVLATGLAFLGLASMAVALADMPLFAFWFVIGAAASFIVLLGTGRGIMALAKRIRQVRNPDWRMAVANLHRPGSQTSGIVLSLGLGLTLLVTIMLIDGNISTQIGDRAPDTAPTFFFVDIQPTQIEEFRSIAETTQGVENVVTVPSIRGQVTKINGKKPSEIEVPAEAKWIFRGDRGVTFAVEQPENANIVAGEWWPSDYSGKPIISFGAELADELGLGIGDTITLNILGVEIEAEIYNLRTIDWSEMGINFIFIFAPGPIENVPHTYLATAKADQKGTEALYSTVTETFPNVTAVRMKEAIEAVNGLLRNLSAAVRGASGLTLIAGVMVLAGAMATGHAARVYDAVVLKVLGAERRRIVKTYLIEYALIGLVTAVFSAVAGTISAWAVITQVMQADFYFLPATIGLTVGGATLITVALGLAGTWSALGEKPAPVLRAD